MKTNTRHGAYRLPAGIWPVVLAAVMLIAPGAVRANRPQKHACPRLDSRLDFGG